MNTDELPKIRVYLSLASSDDLLSRVARLLGGPDRILTKGQPIHPENPARTYDQNLYLFGQLVPVPSLDVPGLVKQVLARIEGRSAAIAGLGVAVQLAIVVEFKSVQAPILSFDREILAALHEIGASLDIDTYVLC